MTRPTLSSAGLMAAGFLAAIVLTSNGIVSAISSSYVVLTNDNGTRSVGITKAKQLLATATDAGDIVHIEAVTPADVCVVLYNVPNGKNLILKSAVMYVAPATPGSFSLLALHLTSCLTGRELTYAGHDQQATIHQTYGEGIVVPGGTALVGREVNGTGHVFVYGHLVPKVSPAP